MPVSVAAFNLLRAVLDGCIKRTALKGNLKAATKNHLTSFKARTRLGEEGNQGFSPLLRGS